MVLLVFLTCGLIFIGWKSEASYSNVQFLFQKTKIVIKSSNKSNEFVVELALTEGEQTRGLMYRSHLDQNAGMLFLFDTVEEKSMWMKNTFIPLDIIFIGDKGYIRKIVDRTVPQSETLITSGVPVKGVLELLAGTADRLGIRVGDHVRGKSTQLFP